MQPTIGIIDIETGGFSVSKNGICEIALLVVSEDLTTVISANTWLIKPYTRADDTDEIVSYKEDAMAVNGISIDTLIKDGKDVAYVCRAFINQLQAKNVKTLLGHNVKGFDIPRIEHLTKRFIQKDLSEYDAQCTLEASKRLIKSESYKLEYLCNKLGIIQEQTHRALDDCYFTLELARELRHIKSL